MEIEFDQAKREITWIKRGLDFVRAAELFAGRNLTRIDPRHSEELRLQTIGWLDGRLVMVVWTPRGACRRIISIRSINERERAKVAADLSGPEMG